MQNKGRKKTNMFKTKKVLMNAYVNVINFVVLEVNSNVRILDEQVATGIERKPQKRVSFAA